MDESSFEAHSEAVTKFIDAFSALMAPLQAGLSGTNYDLLVHHIVEKILVRCVSTAGRALP